MNLDLVHGNCGFRVSRHRLSLQNEAFKAGFRVETASGKNKGSALDALSGSAFFSDPLAIVISEPLKDVEATLELARLSDERLHIICIQNSTIPKSSKLIKGLKEARVSLYQIPTKPWELAPHGVAFGIATAKAMGTPVSKSLVESLVARVGADLPVIYWEIKKASVLAALEGSSSIEAQHVKKTLAPIAEVGPDSLIDPIEKLQAKKFLQAAMRVQNHAGKDPTMWTSAILSKRILLWLAVAHAFETNVPMDSLAARLEKNAWYLKNQVLPPAKRWGSKGCAELLSALAASERSVKTGAAAPFNQLVSLVVGAILRRRGHR